MGGHCIPVDPYYLAWRAREFDFTERFIELAGDINFGMPRHVVDLVAEALNDRGKALKGARVGVLGVAFKPDVQDARNSPAGAVLPGIIARGAELRYHDPLIPRFRDDTGVTHEGVGLDCAAALGGRVRGGDAAQGRSTGTTSTPTRRSWWTP